MKLQLIGCTHRLTPLAKRERLAFDAAQAAQALRGWRRQFPMTEAVLLSTCNRIELYTASEGDQACPSQDHVARFLADFHSLPVDEVVGDLFAHCGEDAVRHLFTVAASLDSMVVGEPQILAQVKQAYQLANTEQSTGPLTHGIFQAAVRVAKRVATETAIHQRRVSIPSVAVADFASQIFEHFDDKQVLVVGAGEMAEETLRYLRDEGARRITVINRSGEKAAALAAEWNGEVAPWERLHAELIRADLVVSTTSAAQAIVNLDDYQNHVAPQRYQRTLFILDLAVPRDFDPAIGQCKGVYLFSLDDLSRACERNREQRDKELPAALAIVEEETKNFTAQWYHRLSTPVISQLLEGAQESKGQEIERLLAKLPELDERQRQEVIRAFDRLVNKLLHPPLESLRDESREGPPHGLLDALKRLFNLSD
ncbi:MAG: glutamyl-tRNA reductase [Pirellulales bacterium]